MLAACHGAGTVGGTGSNVIPQVAPQGADTAFVPDTLSPVNIYPGEVVGQPDMFKPHQGDTIRGGRGKTVDRIPCDPTEYLNDYHVHAYLGIIYKGKQVAVPEGIGMLNPGAPQNGYITSAHCYYFIHTHDQSGLIHVEAPATLPPSASPHTFQNFLDIWGEKYTSTSFAAFKGGLNVYVGNVSALGQTTVSSYTRFKDVTKLGTIPLRSHEVIWIQIGKPVLRHMPSVTFYTEY
jgi:hypothetical protein